MEASGGVTGEISCRIAQASGAFGNLRDPVFTTSDWTMETKRMVYRSVVLEVLLYGAEPGPPPRIWLVSWTGSTVSVFVAFWV